MATEEAAWRAWEEPEAEAGGRRALTVPACRRRPRRVRPAGVRRGRLPRVGGLLSRRGQAGSGRAQRPLSTHGAGELMFILAASAGGVSPKAVSGQASSELGPQLPPLAAGDRMLVFASAISVQPEPVSGHGAGAHATASLAPRHGRFHDHLCRLLRLRLPEASSGRLRSARGGLLPLLRAISTLLRIVSARSHLLRLRAPSAAISMAASSPAAS